MAPAMVRVLQQRLLVLQIQALEVVVEFVPMLVEMSKVATQAALAS